MNWMALPARLREKTATEDRHAALAFHAQATFVSPNRLHKVSECS